MCLLGITHDITETNGVNTEEAPSEQAVETPLESGDLGTANKHEHATDIDGDIDLDIAREPKRIKIEAEDEQDPAKTANGDGHAADQEAEPLSDTEQSQEPGAPHVQEEEDEVLIHLFSL